MRLPKLFSPLAAAKEMLPGLLAQMKPGKWYVLVASSEYGGSWDEMPVREGYDTYDEAASFRDRWLEKKIPHQEEMIIVQVHS